MAAIQRVSMTVDATQFVCGKPRTRAALSNGSLLPAGVDGRSAAARRFRDLVMELSKEVLGEAEGELSAAQTVLVKQCSLVTIRVEALQADAVSGAVIDDNDLVRLTGALARAFTALAKMRAGKPKHAAPSIAEHFARKRANVS
jgi:hypothetical protein